ncbi:MAG: polyphosphate kinase 1, partial [Bacteroidia bacterium]|nr:polyphosphate kinase 1 [Bacteroidia bacterium]
MLYKTEILNPPIKKKYINREISWLSFNERVLQEAADPSVPLLERLKFLGIFSNNRDEFFRVRVAGLLRLIKLKKKDLPGSAEDPRSTLKTVQEIVAKQQAKFDSIHKDILKELRDENIHILSEKDLNSDQAVFVNKFFKENLLPSLVPIMLRQAPSFPYLKDELLYLIIKITGKTQVDFALVEVPTNIMSRFVIL